MKKTDKELLADLIATERVLHDLLEGSVAIKEGRRPVYQATEEDYALVFSSMMEESFEEHSKIEFVYAEHLGVPDKDLLCSFNNIHGKTEVITPPSRSFVSEVFEDDELIEKIVIPEGVEYIERTAFINCPNLRLIVFPDSIKVIGKKIIKNCPNVRIQTNNQIIIAYAKKNNIPIVEG